jgi:hypothetical protein
MTLHITEPVSNPYSWTVTGLNTITAIKLASDVIADFITVTIIDIVIEAMRCAGDDTVRTIVLTGLDIAEGLTESVTNHSQSTSWCTFWFFTITAIVLTEFNVAMFIAKTITNNCWVA